MLRLLLQWPLLRHWEVVEESSAVAAVEGLSILRVEAPLVVEVVAHRCLLPLPRSRLHPDVHLPAPTEGPTVVF